MNALRGQAKAVLIAVTKNDIPLAMQQQVLLTLAIRTGQHCNRMYLETFADLFHRCGYHAQKLSLKERAVLLAQSAREDAFKRYYYAFMPVWRKIQASTLNPDYFLSADVNDYHAYELFARQFGAFFYLPNQTLSRRTRSFFEIASDHVFSYLLKLANAKLCFSDYYNTEYLIKAVLDGQGKLHGVFKDWCDTIYPEAYNESRLDEDLYPVADDNPRLRTLACLMLLDLGLVESTTPLLNNLSSARPSSYRALLSAFGYRSVSSHPPNKIQVNHPHQPIFADLADSATLNLKGANRSTIF